MAAYKSAPNLTLPGVAAAYAAGDVVGGAFQLTNLPSSTSYDEEHLLITSCGLLIPAAAVPAGMTSFRLQLYSATPPSAIADNAAWSLTAGDRTVYLGYVDIGSPAAATASLVTQVEQVNKHILPGTTGVWAYLVTNGAYTPGAASEVYVPNVHAVLV